MNSPAASKCFGCTTAPGANPKCLGCIMAPGAVLQLAFISPTSPRVTLGGFGCTAIPGPGIDCLAFIMHCSDWMFWIYHS